MQRSWILLAAAGVILTAVSPARAQSSILISEMCDPRYNYTTDRFIEIYNAGDDAVDLAGWSLIAVGNGGDIFTWNLSGSMYPGEALVAGDLTTVEVFPVDFPDEAWSSMNGLWNGKVGDGARLLDSLGTVIDYAVAGGTAFENADYVRNYGIVTPNTTYTPSEWTATPVNLPTEGSPGIHYTEPPTPWPLISNIRTDPVAPTSGMDVDVLADVTDSTATITSVLLRWGTVPSPLPNEIGMSPLSGSTYGTDAPIPPQSAGTTVFFEIQAGNDVPDTSTSDLQSYSVPFEVTIYEIQGQVPASPYGGYEVITHGVVTGRYGSYFAMQDGNGPWNGLWAESTTPPAVGDSVTMRGTVTEGGGLGYAMNTLLADAVVESDSPGAALPPAVVVSTAGASSEEYEGVLVTVENAVCTNTNVGSGEWETNDGSGLLRVGDLGYDFTPTLGTSYDLTGPVTFTYDQFKIEPRDESDVLWVGDDSAPVIFQVSALNDTSVLVTFSEEVEQTGAEMTSHYTIAGLTIADAGRDEDHPDQVLLTVSPMSETEYTLTVNGVADLYENVMVDVGAVFEFIDYSVPEGYYDSAEYLTGEPLKAALHEIIRDHTVYGYDYAWTAFRTTDDKPNGKVWDIYSDIPGGTPPYEYTFGVDEGGVGGVEGTGYTREHSWPRSWFGGEVSPMNSDLFVLYPCDAHVNGNRGSYPYGEVTSPEWTSLNGSERGPCSYPGYAGIVFEPIDAFKGDLARSYLYMSTRYYTEDAAWPGSPMTDGAELRPWAAEMLLEWHAQDPVSQKEIERNGAVFALQQNRNPFIDRPEFAALLFTPTAVEEPCAGARVAGLDRIYPNPFNPVATIRYSIPEACLVTLTLYSVEGEPVLTLVNRSQAAGEYECELDAGGLASGVYFCRLEAGPHTDTRKIVMLK